VSQEMKEVVREVEVEIKGSVFKVESPITVVSGLRRRNHLSIYACPRILLCS